MLYFAPCDFVFNSDDSVSPASVINKLHDHIIHCIQTATSNVVRLVPFRAHT